MESQMSDANNIQSEKVGAPTTRRRGRRRRIEGRRKPILERAAESARRLVPHPSQLREFAWLWTRSRNSDENLYTGNPFFQIAWTMAMIWEDDPESDALFVPQEFFGWMRTWLASSRGAIDLSRAIREDALHDSADDRALREALSDGRITPAEWRNYRALRMRAIASGRRLIATGDEVARRGLFPAAPSCP